MRSMGGQMIEQKLVPAPGHIAVVREFVEEVISKVQRDDGTEIGLIRPDYERDYTQRINPWALVVGVGAPRITDYGTTVQPPCALGDKVLISQIGRYIELTASTGQKEMIYVLPFEGVNATMKYVCSVCKSEMQDDPKGRCPKGCKDIHRAEVSL